MAPEISSVPHVQQGEIFKPIYKCLEAREQEIKDINNACCPLLRLCKILKFLFNYGHFPPKDTTRIQDISPVFRELVELVRVSPLKDRTTVFKIKADTKYYDFRYIRASNGWSVTMIDSNGQNSQTLVIKQEQLLKELTGDKAPLAVTPMTKEEYYATVQKCYDKNQQFLKAIADSFTSPLHKVIISGLQPEGPYKVAEGYKFTVGDVCGSSVTMLLAGFASGTLQWKEKPLELMNIINAYMKLIEKPLGKMNDNTPAEIDALAQRLLLNLVPAASNPPEDAGCSGLLFLGDNMNDRMDSDYDTLATTIALLDRAGAIFLKGNHDVLENGRPHYNGPRDEDDAHVQFHLKHLFRNAYFEPSTFTLYTHNGVKVSHAINNDYNVRYALPRIKPLTISTCQSREKTGEDIVNYIRQNNDAYVDVAHPPYIDQEFSPTEFRPTLDDLESCEVLGLRQVAGHEGLGVQPGNNVVRINGIIAHLGEAYVLPVTRITGSWGY